MRAAIALSRAEVSWRQSQFAAQAAAAAEAAALLEQEGPSRARDLALARADYAVTEAGFAFDLGGEKFFDLKCRNAGLNPAVVVIVATVRCFVPPERAQGGGSAAAPPGLPAGRADSR